MHYIVLQNPGQRSESSLVTVNRKRLIYEHTCDFWCDLIENVAWLRTSTLPTYMSAFPTIG
jgi:hypothetical protein